MGDNYYDKKQYSDSRAIRMSTGRKDFEYTETATKIHPSLDPMRIRTKPFRKLESRDSADHPISLPIILTFDVTGSNYANAEVVQKHLNELMGKLLEVHANPQIAIWANDDFSSVRHNAVQLGEFESDNRIDDAIRSIWLTGRGGNNDGESYDLLIYAAARKTVTDSIEKRHKRGYMFLYADEPFFDFVDLEHVSNIFGDHLEGNIPIASIIKEAQQLWDIFVLWPSDGYRHARNQYVTLFGENRVETVQSPDQLCDKITSIVAREEEAGAQKAQEAANEAAIDSSFAARAV